MRWNDFIVDGIYYTMYELELLRTIYQHFRGGIIYMMFGCIWFSFFSRFIWTTGYKPSVCVGRIANNPVNFQRWPTFNMALTRSINDRGYISFCLLLLLCASSSWSFFHLFMLLVCNHGIHNALSIKLVQLFSLYPAVSIRKEEKYIYVYIKDENSKASCWTATRRSAEGEVAKAFALLFFLLGLIFFLLSI